MAGDGQALRIRDQPKCVQRCGHKTPVVGISN